MRHESGRQFSEPDVIHLWLVDLPQMDASTVETSQLERRAVVERSRNARRRCLEKILRTYFANDQALTFSAEKHGKPFLQKHCNPENLRFNTSFSRGKLAVAVTRTREIGVDIEYIDHTMDFSAICEIVFSPHEIAFLNTLEKDKRTSNFYNLWSSKEAVIKAAGLGLDESIKTLSVTPGVDQRVDFQGMQYQLTTISTIPHYSLVVASQSNHSERIELRCIQT